MDDRPFGARFIDEMRRLTQSSWGLEYGEMQRLAQMDRAEFRATLGHRAAALDRVWDGSDPVASEPEQLARAIVEQGRSADLLTDVVNILGGLA
jgi:hypothetical protein